jgi:serine/threonine protein kinase
MNDVHNLRRSARKMLLPPEVGFFYTVDVGQESEIDFHESIRPLFVDIFNISDNGALLKAGEKIEPKAFFHLQVYNSFDKLWKFFSGKVKWIKKDSTKSGYYFAGLELRPETEAIIPLDREKIKGLQIPLPCDFEFFRSTKLIGFIPRDAVCSLLNSVTYKNLKAGERLMVQGEVGDTCFLIQSGSCIATVKKKGELHPVGRLREGDIVGEMAIITGEPRSAYVDAETDMELWGLTRSQFENISKEHPDLRSFLTELVANRFESRTVTAQRKINKYVITDIIGRGGYSLVYKGLHADLNMPVAIKMMRHDMAMNPDFLKSFWNEAKIIAQFNHENIIKIYDIEDLYQTVFIIMEYLEGRALNDLLELFGTISFPRTVDFLIQICNGLSYAQQKGIIHRDISSPNIFVQPNERLKIIDFGLACPIGTEDLICGGALPYLAPELIDGDPADQRSDIYSLGITLYEMVTGKRPYPEENASALMEMHRNEDIPDPATIVPDLPEEIRGIIFKACHRNPDKRYQDVNEILEDIQPLAEKYGITRKDMLSEKRNMTTLLLVYREENKLAFTKLMSEFSTKAKSLGVIVRGADFKEV